MSSRSWKPSTRASPPPSPAATNCRAWWPHCATSPAPAGSCPARPRATSSRATPATCDGSRSGWSWASRRGISHCGRRSGSSVRHWRRATRSSSNPPNSHRWRPPDSPSSPSRSCRPGVLNVVHGTGGVIGDALVRHPEVDLVSFTGSTAAGPAHRRGRRRGAQASRPRTGRQRPGHHLRRHRPRGGAADPDQRRAVQRRPGMHVRDPDAGQREDPRPVRRGDGGQPATATKSAMRPTRPPCSDR